MLRQTDSNDVTPQTPLPVTNGKTSNMIVRGLVAKGTLRATSASDSYDCASRAAR